MEHATSEVENMELNFWNGKRVFLTGHTGFKGGWLSLWLNLLGAKVYGYALAPSTTPNLFELTQLNKYINHFVGDIRDEVLLKKEIIHFDPEIIIHMAAQPLVINSYESPIETYGVNALGTANLLEAARYAKSVKVILVVTTDKCYENKEWVWSYRENDRLGGHDPYSNSKACAELITQSFRDSFYAKKNIALATARAGNVIGGGDWSKHRLIPDIVRAIAHQEKLLLRYPSSIRPWQHVLESLSGYLNLIEKCFLDSQKYSEAWNFGPHDSKNYSVKQIIEKFQEKINKPFQCEITENESLPESRLLRLNIDKALSKLNWSPKYTIDKSIQITADWYNACLNNEDMKIVTEKQILDYMKLSI